MQVRCIGQVVFREGSEMRNLIWLVVAGAVALGGYLIFTGDSVTELLEDTGIVTDADEGVTGAETTAEDTAEDAVGTVTDAVEEAVENAADALEGVVEGATDAAEEAVESATDAVEEASGAVNFEMLTAEGFDLDQVKEMIANSGLSDSQKTLLTQAIEAAQDDPVLLQSALDQLKAALNL